jgi:hypothetical protein
MRIQPSWENPLFKKKYMIKIHSIMYNLRHSDKSLLFERLARGDVKSKDIAVLTPPELWPDPPPPPATTSTSTLATSNGAVQVELPVEVNVCTVN